MNVPRPCRATTRPSRSRSRYAFATVFGLTARSATTSRTVGSWSPMSSVPSRSASFTWRTICRYVATPDCGSRWNSITAESYRLDLQARRPKSACFLRQRHKIGSRREDESRNLGVRVDGDAFQPGRLQAGARGHPERREGPHCRRGARRADRRLRVPLSARALARESRHGGERARRTWDLLHRERPP